MTAPKPKARSPKPASARTTIAVQGARVHNLKNISVETPRDRLVVVTGLSGSGKSSLAFDTIYAEGQRRYMESLSSYAKRFVAQVTKPDVDFVSGPSPVISIEQKTLTNNPRSTVGTMTDIASYLNLLYATIGRGHCPRTGEPVPSRTSSQILEAILSLPEGTAIELRAPVFKIYGEDLELVFTEIRKKGVRRLIVDGKPVDLSDKVELDDSLVTHMDALVDRFLVGRQHEKAIQQGSVATLLVGDGLPQVHLPKANKPFYESFSKTHHFVYGDIGPDYFVFNNPESACRTCGGLGVDKLTHPELLVPDPKRSIAGGCFVREAYKYNPDTWDGRVMYTLSTVLGFSLDTPGKALPETIRGRLELLMGIGLDYLSFDRRSGTLSGGESQRIRLSTQIGSGLMGMLYVLDEPTIGLHPKDNVKMIATLERLRDIGNTVIVVEHDEETIRAADHIVEMGPGPGIHGGTVVVQGTIDDLFKCKASPTGQYLSGRRSIATPRQRRTGSGNLLTVPGARENNLKSVDVTFPLGMLTAITGASGSGKSTLVNEILYKVLWKALVDTRALPGEHDGVDGIEHVRKVVSIDQAPIGRNSRSNPATYIGFYDTIRELFAAAPLSFARGYQPRRFSFNVKGGRCEECQGEGAITTQLYFMPDVEVTCGACKGARFNSETLEVTLRGKTIDGVLNMSVEEGVEFFASEPAIHRKIQVLAELGLGYLTLGQSATTLSGGEAHRIKIAT